MKKEDVIRMAREAGAVFSLDGKVHSFEFEGSLERFAELVVAATCKELEVELLKLASGIAAPSQYIQGRWDVVGEFQDVLRARGNKT